MKRLQVRTAQNLLEAVSLITARRFNLVIVDWDLQGMQALELLNFLKATHPETPVILFTGMEVDEAFLKTALGGRADAILRKLGPLESLGNEVDRQLAKRRRTLSG